jgi:serine/threonine-protein kinase 19
VLTVYYLPPPDPGRKAVLGMVKKSKYNEVLKAELEERQTNSQVKFQIKYHIHDIIGAELVEW